MRILHPRLSSSSPGTSEPFLLLLFLAVISSWQATLTKAHVAPPSSAWLSSPLTSGNIAPASTAGPNSQWIQILGSNLYFYDEQRAGALPSNFYVDLKNTSVLTDGQRIGVNLSAGFFDAGNFIKVLFSLPCTLLSIIEPALLWGNAFTDAR